jgi:hypothetical protein
LNGSIANFRVYSKALNADQVRELYEYDAERFGYRQNLVALHKGNLGVGVAHPTARFEVAGADGLQEYPPKAMTGYETYIEGHGVFRVIPINLLSLGVYALPTWRAFDKSSDYFTDIWHSERDSDATAGSTGFYTGTSNTYTGTNSLNGVYGDSIILENPYEINVAKIHLKSRINGGSPVQTIRAFTLMASKEGSTWDILTQKSGLTSWTVNGYTFDVQTTHSYRYYAIVVTQAAPDNNYVSLAELRYFGTPAPSSLEDGHLTLGKALTLPRVSGHGAGAETPRAESLVVHYDTTVDSVVSGTSVVDISGNGSNGTLTGGAAYSSTDRALTFDGVDDYVSGTLNNPSGAWVHSVSYWLKPDADTLDDSDNHYAFNIGAVSTTKMSGGGVSNKSPSSIFHASIIRASDYTFIEDAWTHIVIEYTGGNHTSSNVKFYINGDLYNGSYTTSGSNPGGTGLDLNANTPLNLGSKGTSGEEYSGSISNFKIWGGVALTAEEVAQEYALGRTGKSLNLTDTALCLGGTVPRAQLDVRGSALVGGNVGIGTTSPDYKLDVHGSANVGALTVTSVSGLEATDIPNLDADKITSGTLTRPISTTDIKATSFVTGRVILAETWPNASLVGDLGTWVSSTWSIENYTNTSPDGYRVISFRHDGNLTSPTFDVRKYALVDSSHANDAQTKTSTRLFLKCWLYSDSLDNEDTEPFFYIEFSPNNGTTWYEVYRDNSNEDTGTDAGYKMAVADLSPYIDATNSTNAKIRFRGTSPGSGDYYRVGRVLVYESDVPTNLGGMWLGAGGNIGIGTTNPGYKLDVHGTSNVGALTATSVTVPNDGDFVMNSKPLTSASGLHWDTVNSRLGVGVSSPGVRLDIAATSDYVPAIRIGTNTTYDDGQLYSLRFGGNDRMGMGLYSSTQTVFGSQGLGIHIPNTEEYSVRTNGWAKLFALDGATQKAYFGGNVGIGTTSPAQKLDVAGRIRGGTMEMDSYMYHVGDTNTYLGFPANDTFTITTSNAERLRVDSSGYVGIGTTNPREALQVNGNFLGSGNSILYSHNLYFDTAWKYSGASYGGSTIRMIDSEVQFWNAPNDNATADSAATVTQRMTIDAAGNVGIGTASPGSTLDVVGTAAISSNLEVGTANLFVDTATSNVGIGTTSPSSKLHVFGGALSADTDLATFHYTNGNQSYLKIRQVKHTPAATTWEGWSTRIQQVTDVTNQSYIEFNPLDGTYATAFGRGTGEYMRIKDGGNVGIGTTNPAYKLDVHGTSNVGALTATTATVPNDGDFVMGGKPLKPAAGLHWDRTNLRLGVGTTSPQDVLHVYENSTSAEQLRLQNDNELGRAGMSIINAAGQFFNIQHVGGATASSNAAIIENFSTVNGGIQFYAKGMVIINSEQPIQTRSACASQTPATSALGRRVRGPPYTWRAPMASSSHRGRRHNNPRDRWVW